MAVRCRTLFVVLYLLNYLYASAVFRLWLEKKFLTFFLVDAGIGEANVTIEDPNGDVNSVVPRIEKIADDAYKVSYTPKDHGPHQVFVTYGGVEVPDSPIQVPISLRKYDSFIA